VNQNGARAPKRLRPWKTLGSKSLLSAPPWLQVFREQVELPTGRVLDDFYRVVLPDFAMVVPFTTDGKIVMVRGYKHGLGRMNLSPPAGLIEPGEDPLATAQRELLEETGYQADEWTFLGKFVADANRQCGTMHLFVARNARLSCEQREDELEELSLEVMEPSRVISGLCNGEVGNLAGAAGASLALVLALTQNSEFRRAPSMTEPLEAEGFGA
jgi:ADP-ribose pyrophosphatase